MHYGLGVPSIPPQWLGYYHFARTPLYFAEGRLYRVPPEESESNLFEVQAETTENEQRLVLQHPRGGHNYYNNRDMERLLRTMALLRSTGSGKPDWDGYVDRLLASGESQYLYIVIAFFAKVTLCVPSLFN